MRGSAIAALSALMLAAPAFATDPAKQAAVNAQEAPVTQSLNRAIADGTTQTQLDNATAQGQYEADRLAYRNAVIAHNIAVAHDQARYAHQQNAYADAMAAWRIQVEACKRGDTKGCQQPQPDPAAYY